MLRRARELQGVQIHARDGMVGKIDEILFDDEHWTVRYLIADTGSWLNRRQVLLSPLAIGFPDWEANTLHVTLTREQIENSPDVNTDEPVSRQWEASFHGYYGLPFYWGGLGGWGAYSYIGGIIPPSGILATLPQVDPKETDAAKGDCHLRSSREVTGYRVGAIDKNIGRIDDFIIDDTAWRITYLAVETRTLWPGKKVLLPLDWIGRVMWPDNMVTVNVSSDQIMNVPEWDPNTPITPQYEDELNCYYVRQLPLRTDVPAREPASSNVAVF